MVETDEHVDLWNRRQLRQVILHSFLLQLNRIKAMDNDIQLMLILLNLNVFQVVNRINIRIKRPIIILFTNLRGMLKIEELLFYLRYLFVNAHVSRE